MKLTRLSQLYVIVTVFLVFLFPLKKLSGTKYQKYFSDRDELFARIETRRPRGKHVQREESDSRGWWFRTELDRSITGSKLRLSPLSEGYKECCTGEETRIVEVVLAITAVEMSSCASAFASNLSLLHPRNFRSIYTILSLPYENSYLSEHDLILLLIYSTFQ